MEGKNFIIRKYFRCKSINFTKIHSKSIQHTHKLWATKQKHLQILSWEVFRWFGGIETKWNRRQQIWIHEHFTVTNDFENSFMELHEIAHIFA